MPPEHGLTQDQLNCLKKILTPFAGDIDRVVLFGSRALGNYRPYSDIDLALYGPLVDKDLDRIFTLFMESNLPLKVDIVSYQSIQSIPLKQHIDQAGVTLFTKERLGK